MRKIHVFALLMALLLSPAFAPGADAARRRTSVQEPPKPTVMEAFQKQLQEHSYFCDATQRVINSEIEKYINELLNLKENRADYVQKNQLTQYVEQTQQQLNDNKEKSERLIQSIIDQYPELDAQQKVDVRKQMEDSIDARFNTISNNLKRLRAEMEVKDDEGIAGLNWKLIGIIVGALLLLLIIIAIAARSKKSKANVYTPTPAKPRPAGPASRPAGSGANTNMQGQQVSADGNIIVRRKTATILKKQSLEDVIDNPNYLQVDAVDFTYESAVRRMYIKNQCIVDIYNMYAEDLRNPESPKEDGCMVLGRWVYDKETNEYYVSLEEIVLPGDDAVFEEYALNFGGKIKLKVLEELRRLRRETNLQYDLTCWVHSHPGLGVFFSNSDTSVQDQLKHPTHPNFLTALVVDILTPMQDVGVFTYRRDTTINSKQDLKKMYSLVEWYQWAQQSLKTAVQRPVAQAGGEAKKELSASEFFNTLEKTQDHDDSCQAVQLSKSVVIDICMDLATEGDDVMALLHGYANQQGQKVEYVAEKISDSDNEPKLSLTGCFVSAPHCSIPTVRKAVQDYLDRIHYVLVYTPNDGLLTTIPVINGDLCTEYSFYGEQRMEVLKNWIKQNR